MSLFRHRRQASLPYRNGPGFCGRGKSRAKSATFLSQELLSLNISVCPSEANYLLLRAPVGLDTALLRRGIAIRSCENYPGLGPGWYRIAVRLHEENEALLETMRRVTEEAHGI